MNTKNDEHENFVARLKATHEEDLDRILSDCTQKLQECKEKLSLEKERAEMMVVSLNESLSAAEKERDQLYKEQVCHWHTPIDFCVFTFTTGFVQENSGG